MSVLNKVVSLWDGENRRAYLAEGTADYYPIEDIYHEYRNARKTDEELRKYAALLRAEGNIPKGGGAFTPRYVVLLNGFKIVPFNETLQLNQLGDMITDDPDTDATLYDVSGLTVAKPIFIKPSNAETVQLNSESIVFSSFQGAVWIDVTSPYDSKGSATEPNGNTERPVNNVQLAVEIAEERGLDTLQIIGQVVLALGDDVSGFTIRGNNPITSVLIAEPAALTINTYIRDLYFTGTLDGGTILRDCVLGAIDYFDGYIEHCALTSNTYKIHGVGILIDCFAGATCTSDPIIDMTDGLGLGIRSFVGNLTITEKHGPTSCQIMINGKLTVADTCDNGELQTYGDGYVVDNSTGTFVLVDKTTGSPQEIAQAVVDVGIATKGDVIAAAFL